MSFFQGLPPRFTRCINTTPWASPKNLLLLHLRTPYYISLHLTPSPGSFSQVSKPVDPTRCLMLKLLPRDQSSPLKSRAPHIERVYRDESESTASLVDVDSPHVQSVDSGFLNQDVKTTTQAERIEREEQAEEERKAQEKRKAKAKRRSSAVSRNKDNPVFIGNAVLLGLVGAGLGFGAYKKHAEGSLSWETVGLWTGAVGAFGAVDYFVSKWFLQNKYPPK